MVMIVRGIDDVACEWGEPQGGERSIHVVEVTYLFVADPVVSSVTREAMMDFLAVSPREHITFFAVDVRTLNEYQKLAYAVFMGDDAMATILADAVMEHYFGSIGKPDVKSET